jgi:hypothetical protein
MSFAFPKARRLGALGASGFVLGALVVLNTAAAPAAAAPAAQAVCPAGAPVLSLANPNPGDVLPTGDFIVSGQAFDPAASTGSGIARVDLFLGSRDSGGLFLGSALPAEGPSGQLFQVKATLPSSTNGGRDFVAYAYSAVNGQQTSVSVPVFVGAAPTPTPTGTTLTPVALAETTVSTCHAPSVVGSPAAPSVPPVQQVPLASSAAPFLQLANPSAGASLPSGDLIVEGLAYDLATTQGSGIDRIELFVDSRENGGLLVGSGVPGEDGALGERAFRIKAKLSNISNGGHNFVVYARSSVTGQETVTSVPVFIGVAPTPTPRPAGN